MAEAYEEFARYKESDQTPEVKKLLERIPDEWGKYLDIGPGWYDLVVHLDHELAEINPDYVIHQVKQKFGGLRYYTDFIGNDRAYELIRLAEAAAEDTCEECGARGAQLRRRGAWYDTYCDTCAPDGYEVVESL